MFQCHINNLRVRKINKDPQLKLFSCDFWNPTGQEKLPETNIFHKNRLILKVSHITSVDLFNFIFIYALIYFLSLYKHVSLFFYFTIIICRNIFIFRMNLL